jgi:molybdenum cofactor synthesis domain-containing protein
MQSPRAAMVVIGDEILSGRTRDSNMHHLANALTDHGIALQEARMIADDHDTIVETVRTLAGAFDHVFTSGGIGPTHDDITADAIADAMGASIDVRADARAILQAHYDAMGTELNAARLRMARIPDGACLIDNPVSAAPGFSLGNVHVMAGVPRIFEAMLAGLLPSPDRWGTDAVTIVAGATRRGRYRANAGGCGRYAPGGVHRLLSLPSKRCPWVQRGGAQPRWCCR